MYRFESASLQQHVEANEELLATVERLTKETVSTVYVQNSRGFNPFVTPVTRENYRDAALTRDEVARVGEDLVKAGFEVLHEGTFAIVVRASIRNYEDRLPCRFMVSSRSRDERPRRRDLILVPEDPSALAVRPEIPGVLRIAIEPPAQLHQDTRPRVGPNQVDAARLLDLLRVENATIESLTGVTMAIIDSGFDLDHEAFAARRFTHEFVDPVGCTPANVDCSGHGTAMLAVASTIAPQAHFVLSNTLPCEYAAIERTAARRPGVLSCSWGWDECKVPEQPAVRAAIYKAIDEGIVLAFASGNFGLRSWPAALADVIAVGGVYVGADDKRRPSTLTSSFESLTENRRPVPDFCGLSGRGRVPYILVPVPAGSETDQESAVETGSFDPDNTQAHDGWAFVSLSSGATAQVAAAAALVRAANSKLTPDQVKHVLKETTRDAPMTPGSAALTYSPTGTGLVDVAAAIAMAKDRPSE